VLSRGAGGFGLAVADESLQGATATAESCPPAEAFDRFRGVAPPEGAQARQLGRDFAGFASLCGLAALLWGAPARAQTSQQQAYDLGQVQTPRGLGMGDAQNALGSSTTALYNNPANLALTRAYHFEALAAWGPEGARQSYGGSVADSMTNRLAGGFGGGYSLMDATGVKRQWLDARVSLAYPIVLEKLFIGGTVRFLRVTQDVAAGPFGPSKASDGAEGAAVFQGFLFDAGVTVSPVPELKIGAVGHNLNYSNTGFAPLVFGGGVGVQIGQVFAAEADVLCDANTWLSPRPRVMGGAEVFLFHRLALRAGYRFDEGQRAHSVAFGAGWVDKKFSVEIGFRRDVASDSPITMFGTGVRYFYDSGQSDEASQPLVAGAGGAHVARGAPMVMGW
jgi:hypothetical protein